MFHAPVVGNASIAINNCLQAQIGGKPGFVNPCAQGNTYSYSEEGARFLPAAFPLKGPGWVSPATTARDPHTRHGSIQPLTNRSVKI